MDDEMGELIAALQRYTEDDECILTPDAPDYHRYYRSEDHWDRCNFCRAMEALYATGALDRTP